MLCLNLTCLRSLHATADMFGALKACGDEPDPAVAAAVGLPEGVISVCYCLTVCVSVCVTDPASATVGLPESVCYCVSLCYCVTVQCKPLVSCNLGLHLWFGRLWPTPGLCDACHL